MKDAPLQLPAVLTGDAAVPTAGTLTMRRLLPHNPSDRLELQTVLASAPAYSLLVEGRVPPPTAADELLATLPPGKTPSDKFVFAVRTGDPLIGCIDLIRGHPEPHITFIGLLLFAEAAQGHGNGAAVLRQVELLARSWGCSALRIAVIESNVRAIGFWQRWGFTERYRSDVTGFTGRAIVMERTLPVFDDDLAEGRG